MPQVTFWSEVYGLITDPLEEDFHSVNCVVNIENGIAEIESIELCANERAVCESVLDMYGNRERIISDAFKTLKREGAYGEMTHKTNSIQKTGRGNLPHKEEVENEN